MKLNLVLNNKGFILVVNFLWEFGGDCMMSGLVLDDETLITNHAIEDGWLLDVPLSNIGPFFFGGLVILLCARNFPSSLPVVGELFKERSFDGRDGLAGNSVSPEQGGASYNARHN